jgi:hypothetical protein
MILKVIFIQRKCRYPGELAPEAMECMTEYCYDENPEWLDTKLEEYQKESKENEYVSVKIIDIKVNQDQIANILVPANVVIDGIISK